jgi:predicted Co/Zn/Cd cation transporter (cation efflux family)
VSAPLGPHKGPLYPPGRREITAVDGVLALLAVVLVVQMWLLTAALEAYLAGHHETALPAAIASGVLFASCCALFLFVRRLDRRLRR